MTANDNDPDWGGPGGTPFGNHMLDGKLGDVFTHLDGSRWELVAFCPHPTVVLNRVGAPVIPLKDRDQIHLIPSSPIAAEWHGLGDFDPETAA